MLTDFVITALAVFWAWEFLLILSPVHPPAWLQPILVAVCALGAAHVSGPYLTAGAVAGAVALLHRAVAEVPALVQRPRRRGLPRL